MKNFASGDAERLVSLLEREDATLFRYYLCVNVLHTALAQYRLSSPIIGPDAVGQDLIAFIRKVRPELNGSEQLQLKHAVDEYLRESKRALEFWDIDPTVMGG